MKTIAELASVIWERSRSIDFGDGNACVPEMFREDWVNENHPTHWHNASGWYWFLTDASEEYLKDLKKPVEHASVMDIGANVRINLKTLPRAVICTEGDAPLRVVYNGMQLSIFSRLRQHTATTAKGAGSLGLNFYPELVSGFRWQVRYFHAGMIDELTFLGAEERALLTALASTSERSRVAVESAWRFTFGWPLFNLKGLEGRKLKDAG